METNELNDFATRYTAAWCSQNAAIANAAHDFMTAFPDLVIELDGVNKSESDITYHWTLIPIRRNRQTPGRGNATYAAFRLEENWKDLPAGKSGRVGC